MWYSVYGHSIKFLLKNKKNMKIMFDNGPKVLYNNIRVIAR